MDYYGYAGQILHVDLTSGDIRKESLDTDFDHKFLGSWGINYRLAYDLLKPGTEPLSPGNLIILGVGPLIGTLVPGAGKVAATTKLPTVASKHERKYVVATAVGGSQRFGAMIKNAGYDNVVMTGRAKKPSYLKIIDDDVEICHVKNLSGGAPFEDLLSPRRNNTYLPH
jgi:aldehyde:ferredoxin oxidoreductase